MVSRGWPALNVKAVQFYKNSIDCFLAHLTLHEEKSFTLLCRRGNLLSQGYGNFSGANSISLRSVQSGFMELQWKVQWVDSNSRRNSLCREKLCFSALPFKSFRQRRSILSFADRYVRSRYGKIKRCNIYDVTLRIVAKMSSFQSMLWMENC